jgi:hypothetical protein
LCMPYFSVRGNGCGDGRSGILSKAEAANQVEVELGQMAGAVRIAKGDFGKCRNQIHPPQPIFDRRLEFPLQYVRHARYRLQIRNVGPQWSFLVQCRTWRFKKMFNSAQ